MRSFGIIGLGSIGRRHARIIKSLVPDADVRAYRTRQGALLDACEQVTEISESAFLCSTFDVIVIANPSSLHLHTLRDVIQRGQAPIVLVEKPFCLPAEAAAAAALIDATPQVRVLPGNCLRFHPAIDRLKESIASGSLGRILECHAHFGTYMPGWHPYEDYRSTYAARRELGGGVVLTSIHEIDLLHHLFGEGRILAACTGQLALTETDVEDTAHILLSLERCRLAHVSLNFFERPSDRYLKILFERGAWLWRFGQPAVSVTEWRGDAARQETHEVDASVDAMYVGMWRRVLGGSLADFEMASVFSSLRTAEAALADGEAVTWN